MLSTRSTPTILSSSHSGALKRVHTDTAETNDHHSLTGAHISSVDRRTPTSCHATADQSGSIQWDVWLDLDAAGLAYNREWFEGADTAHHSQIGTICGVMPRCEICDLFPSQEKGPKVAEVLLTDSTRRTASTSRDEAQNDVIAGHQVSDTRAYLHHLTSTLVPADDRQLLETESFSQSGIEHHVTGHQMVIRVTEA